MIQKIETVRGGEVSLDQLNSLPNTYGWPTENERGYKLQEHPSGFQRPMRVIVLGAGASAISFAKFAQEELRNVEVVLYEKNDDVGGTWLENRYPGCACDVPSVTYQFVWEPYIWSRFYAGSAEIQQYLRFVVDKYGLWKYIKLQHQIERADWDDSDGKWNISVQTQGKSFVDQCDVFINAGGPLNYWEWPKIDGLESFKGVKAHSADYPKGIDLKGKRVAVAGIGSSGIQIIAAIQKEVSHLYCWVRSPTYVVGGFGTKYLKGSDPNPECK
jgi:cation diffusion facilitator CzcD-associated flavoprotein CzcO